MIKTIEIVSLSSGIIGESFATHELKIGVKRLESMGLQVRFSKNALKGIEYIKNHPEDRASDLLDAYANPDVDMILCAIGGDDMTWICFGGSKEEGTDCSKSAHAGSLIYLG